MRICPFCSTENEAFFRFCLGCGADLDDALGEGTEAAQPPPVAPAPVAKAEPAPPRPRAATESPRVTKDTALDMAPVSAAAIDADQKARAARTAAISAPPAPPAPAMPSSPPPRLGRDRDKTLEPGGPVKPGSAASQAVAQAQHPDVRRPSGPTENVGAIAAGLAKASAIDLAHADTLPQPVRGDVPRARQEQQDEATKTDPRPASSPGVQRPGVARVASDTNQRRTAIDNTPPPPRAGEKRAGPPTVPRPKARLVIILEDGTDGSVLDLAPETTVIGRDGVDISFPHDDFLAKRHAELTFQDGVLYLKPLESTNGVFLQVHQEVELDNGDIFRIGQQLLCFEMLSVVAAGLAVDPKGQAIPLGSPVPEGAWGRLGQLIAPETLGSVYLLGGNEVYLGRERGDITFPGDGFVSGLHAQISMRNGRSFLKDLGSSNGTYLRLSKATPVRRGMLVLAGQQLFRVES